MEHIHYENNLVLPMTRQQATSTLGGTVDVFRSCVRMIVNSTFCNNGMISSTMLPSKGALVVESPSCVLEVVQTLFAYNTVHTSGAAMLVRYHALACSQAVYVSRCTRIHGGQCLQVQSAVPGTMPRVNRCVFARNSAKQTGGALRIESVTGDMSVQASAFTDNWACAGGGGISISSSSNVYVRDSLIMRNSAVVKGCLPGADEEWTPAQGGGILHVRPPLYHAI